ncbi:hypothetical protein Cob_v010905 [Colletotrichum orbiculare MAFF 240422]|uniref:Uncharacterized protein n=1 Tax=Colletotrichum orbiculare (strain 104-T / ATCC 96160 / CBS 514.97 / LARS 414 / MAFF 240422) TaxID=1213857 RepID=A0A484FGZ5_COLOR|nr:hypothetical protein Cob_v010905 [Colletotrichum orbiculare MAFF 240422]
MVGVVRDVRARNTTVADASSGARIKVRGGGAGIERHTPAAVRAHYPSSVNVSDVRYVHVRGTGMNASEVASMVCSDVCEDVATNKAAKVAAMKSEN